MTVLTEKQHTGDALIFEIDQHYSRETVSITAGDLEAQTVLGMTLFLDPYPDDDNTGNGVLTTGAVGEHVQLGDYTVRITAAASNAGSFNVISPDGTLIGQGTVGVAFASSHIGFTLADGSTDFVVGDQIFVTVELDGYEALDADATDGAQIAAAVLYVAADASGAPVKAVAHVRGAVFNAAELVWPSGMNSADLEAFIGQLNRRGILTSGFPTLSGPPPS